MASTPSIPPQNLLLSIGQVAELSSVPITTLRYYEKRGLIDPPGRVGGQRRFGREVLMRLMVVRFCQIAGLTLEEIHEVVQDQSADRVTTKQLAAQRIVAIDHQIDELETAKLMLAAAMRCVCPSVESCTCAAMDDAVEQMLDGVRQG